MDKSEELPFFMICILNREKFEYAGGAYTNDWNELCDACSSLMDEAKMTDSDIDDIVMKVKNGAI